VYEDSARFPGTRLQRALNPRDLNTPNDLGKYDLLEHWDKLLTNTARIVQEDLPRYGGSWISAFFLAGLLVPFSRPALTRLRHFTTASLAVLVFLQALGRTHLSGEVPEVTSENLLVAVAPLVFIFGAGMFVLLLEQLNLTFLPTRNLVAGLFCAVICLPLFFAIINPRRDALAYPPYHPALVQNSAHWMTPDELMMSDMPWAVAWYGHRDCVWLTWDSAKEFDALSRKRPVQALYLTQLTMDRKFLSEMLNGDDPAWGRFAVGSIAKEEIPTGFPLKHAFVDWFPDQLFMSDRPRWKE
jgi:hypothetical protein